MKTKKILAVLSAVIMSASACVAAVPANAETGWKTAYQNKLKELANKQSGYTLFDVDGNGTPELFFEGEFDVPTPMYTYENGELKTVLDGILTEAVAKKLTYLYNQDPSPAGRSYYINFADSTVEIIGYSGDPAGHFYLFYNYNDGVLTPQSYYEGDFPDNFYFHDGNGNSEKASEEDYVKASSVTSSTTASTTFYAMNDFTPFDEFEDEEEPTETASETETSSETETTSETESSPETESSSETETASETAEPTTEKKTEDAWREAYKKKLDDFKNSSSYTDFSKWDLQDIDGDNIPELLISYEDKEDDASENNAYDADIYTYKDNDIAKSDSLTLIDGGTFFYSSSKQYVYTLRSKGDGIDQVREYYLYDDGDLKFLDKFTINGEEEFWLVNDEEVTESEYKTKISPYTSLTWKEIGRQYDFDSTSAIDDWKAPETTSNNNNNSKTNSSSSSSSSKSSSSSTSKSSSSNSSSTTTGSPKTGEALPVATGLTAISALTASIFLKKKKH